MAPSTGQVWAEATSGFMPIKLVSEEWAYKEPVFKRGWRGSEGQNLFWWKGKLASKLLPETRSLCPKGETVFE